MNRLLTFGLLLIVLPCGAWQHDSAYMSTQASLEAEIRSAITSDLPKALEMATNGLETARNNQNKAGEVTLLTLLEEIYFRMADYARAAEYGLLSIELNKAAVHNDIALAHAYRTLGNIYNFGLKQYEEALEYYAIALKVYEAHNDQKMIATQYSSISWLYGITGKKLNEGLAMAEKGIRIARQINDLQLQAYNYNSKGILFTRLELYDSAITVLLKSIEFGKQVNDKAVVAYDKTLVGEAYFKKGNFGSAIRYFREAAEESARLQTREVEKDAYLGMSQYYEAIGDTDQALHYFRRYTALKDSLLNRDVSEKAIFYENRLEQEHQQSVIAQLELANHRTEKEKQFVILLLVMGVLLFGLILFFISRNNKQRKATNRLLQEKNTAIVKQNKALEELNDTKDKLFSIIGHDMRSPIANLSAILEMMERKVMHPEEMQQVLPKLNQSVGGLQEMLESLLEWSRSQMQGFQLEPERINLKEIGDKTLSFYDTAAQDKKISLSNCIPEHLFAYADKNHVLLTLRNLVNNAIKFSHPGGLIELNGKIAGNYLEISVQDNGVGIEPQLLKVLFQFQRGISRRGTKGEKGTGFGLALCREMVEANGGTIRVDTAVDKGSAFRFTLPLETPKNIGRLTVENIPQASVE